MAAQADDTNDDAGGYPPVPGVDAPAAALAGATADTGNNQLNFACWAAAMEKSQAAEERARLMFPGGKAFPIPDRECDLTDDPPPMACYHAVNDRPVMLVPMPDGGMDVQALNMRTGVFERDMGYLTRCVSGEGDVDTFPDEAAFLARVREIRARLAQGNDTTPAS